MSRFYQSGKPEFVEDFMYTPPWELVQQALAYNDAGIDKTMETASLFDNINVEYIPDPVEKAIVERELKKYSDKADEYSTNMQLQLQNSPQSWKKYMPQLQALGTDLNKNMKTGNLSKVQQSAAALAKWQEDNKKIKEENPELYNIGMNYFINQWRKNPNRSLDSTFSGDQLINFDVTSKKFTDGLKDFKESLQQSQNGMYLVNNEWVDSRKVEQAYFDMVMADPNAAPFLRQMAKFGVPGYYDPETGGIVNPYTYVDSEGKEISAEQYQKEVDKWEDIDPTYRNTIRKPSREFNPRFAWTGAFKAMGAKEGYSKVTLEQDKVKEAEAGRKQEWAILGSKQAHDMKMASINHENAKEIARIKAISEGGSNKYAAGIARELGISHPTLFGKKVDYSNMINSLKSKDSTAYQNWFNAAKSKDALATMGIELMENGLSTGSDVKTKMRLVQILNAQNIKGLTGNAAVNAAAEQAVKEKLLKKDQFLHAGDKYAKDSDKRAAYDKKSYQYVKMMYNYESAKKDYIEKKLNRYESLANTLIMNPEGAQIANYELNQPQFKDQVKFLKTDGTELSGKDGYTFEYISTIPGFSEGAEIGDNSMYVQVKDKKGRDKGQAIVVPRGPGVVDWLMEPELYSENLRDEVKKQRNNWKYHLLDNTIKASTTGVDEWVDIRYVLPGTENYVKIQVRNPSGGNQEIYRLPTYNRVFDNKEVLNDFINELEIANPKQ